MGDVGVGDVVGPRAEGAADRGGLRAVADIEYRKVDGPPAKIESKESYRILNIGQPRIKTASIIPGAEAVLKRAI